MEIGGFQKTSLIDFPNFISAVVFANGCNFRCPYCFNAKLALGKAKLISEKKVLAFLQKRVGLLDGVVISGGEPCLQKDLREFIKKIKKMGYKIKLDTNGSRPEILEKLLKANLLDYVAMDYKIPLEEKFLEVLGGLGKIGEIRKSLEILAKSKIPFELRTTVVPGVHDEKILIEMARQLKRFKRLNVSPFNKWFWQEFVPGECLDKKFNKIKPFTKGKTGEFIKEVKVAFPLMSLR